jgi:hypothetical protein
MDASRSRVVKSTTIR